MEAKSPAEKIRTRKKNEKKREQGLHYNFEFCLAPQSAAAEEEEVARFATCSPDALARAVANEVKPVKDGECASLFIETEPKASCEFHKAKLFEKKLLHDEELSLNVVFPDTNAEVIAHSLDLVMREPQTRDFTQIPQIAFTTVPLYHAIGGNYARTPYGVPRYPYKLPDSYIRYTVPDATKRAGLFDTLEYDMDSDDEAFLEKQCPGVTPETFEKMIDRLEKESYLATSEKPENVILAQLETEENDDECDICGDGASDDANQIVYCDGNHCDVKVHQNCYGVPFIPEGNWLCCPCQEQLIHHDAPVSRVCCLCHHSGGALKRTTDNRYCHVVCGIWIPDATLIFQRGRGITKWLDAIDVTSVHGRDAVCDICGGSGACISCDVASCKSKYHPSCAMKRKDFLMKTNFQYLFHDSDMRNPAYSTLCNTHKKKHGASWKHVCRRIENKGFLTPCGNTFQTEQQVVAHIGTCTICTATINTTYVMTKKTIKETRQLKERPVPQFLCGRAAHAATDSLTHTENTACAPSQTGRNDVSFLKVIGQMPRKRLFIDYGSSVAVLKRRTDSSVCKTPSIVRSESCLLDAESGSDKQPSLPNCKSCPTSKDNEKGAPAAKHSDGKDGDQNVNSLEDVLLEIELRSLSDSEHTDHESNETSKLNCSQNENHSTRNSEVCDSLADVTAHETVARPLLQNAPPAKVQCIAQENSLESQKREISENVKNSTAQTEKDSLTTPVPIMPVTCNLQQTDANSKNAIPFCDSKLSETAAKVEQMPLRAQVKDEKDMQQILNTISFESDKNTTQEIQQPLIKDEINKTDRSLSATNENSSIIKTEPTEKLSHPNNTCTKNTTTVASPITSPQHSAPIIATVKQPDASIETEPKHSDQLKEDLDFFGIPQDALQSWFPDVPLEKVNQVVDFWVQKRKHKNNAYLLRRFDPYILCVNRPVYATSNLPCDDAMFKKLKNMRRSLVKTRYLINCTIRREEEKLKRLKVSETIAAMLTMTPLAKSLLAVLKAVKHLDKYHLFRVPLSPKRSPELYIRTPHPMCFLEMESKVKNNKYPSSKPFLDDLRDCFMPYVGLGNASALRKALAKEYIAKVVAPLENVLVGSTVPELASVRSVLPCELQSYCTAPLADEDKECHVEWETPDAAKVTKLFGVDWQDLLHKGKEYRIDVFSGNGEFELLKRLHEEREAAEERASAKRLKTESSTAGLLGDRHAHHHHTEQSLSTHRSSHRQQRQRSEKQQQQQQQVKAGSSIPNTKYLKEYFIEFVDLFIKCLTYLDKHSIFAFPVNDFIAPGYSQIIKHPMSLFTMKSKARAREYRRFSQLKRDFLYMCDNALLWNPETSIYYLEAEKMKRNGQFLFKRLQGEIKRCLVAGEPLDFKRVLPSAMKGLAAPSAAVQQAQNDSSNTSVTKSVLKIPMPSCPSGVNNGTTLSQQRDVSNANCEQTENEEENAECKNKSSNGEASTMHQTGVQTATNSCASVSDSFIPSSGRTATSASPSSCGTTSTSIWRQAELTRGGNIVCSASASVSASASASSPLGNGQSGHAGVFPSSSSVQNRDMCISSEQQAQPQTAGEHEMDVESSPRAPQILSDNESEDDDDCICGDLTNIDNDSDLSSKDDDIVESVMSSAKSLSAAATSTRLPRIGLGRQQSIDRFGAQCTSNAKTKSRGASVEARHVQVQTKDEQCMTTNSDNSAQRGATFSGVPHCNNKESGGIISVVENYPNNQSKKVQKSLYSFFPKKN